MPLICGEREYAFTRLQLEVISRYDDESVLVWRDNDPRKKCEILEVGYHFQQGISSSPVVAPMPEYFRHSMGLIRHRFDTNRRGFVMTNTGLEMTAEPFQLEDSNTDDGYPVVFLLRPSEPDEDHALEVYDKFFSLGKHSIVILDHDTPLSPVTPRKETLSFKMRVALSLSMGTWAYTAQRISTGSWDIESTATLGGAISTLSKGAAYICRTKPKDRTLIHSASFTVIVKWKRRSLSCGIWNMAWATNQDLANLLDSDQDRLWPLVAPLPSDLRIGLAHQEMAIKIRVMSDNIGDGHVGGSE
ncbi:hypothetical protein QBC38DRAFT_503452 [Podospora fimiseda]|uniref:Uncharacterized protein n=1 Tax=Podospora fimiseda TaxID=252190 RepID=A0AAN6YPH8_9PEZI|nr:hypothetical protein QBC38DRAFT_503452 [Podospora fimiseda]